MSELDIVFTLKVFVILVVAFLVIAVWDEILLRIMFKYLYLDRDSIFGWFVIGMISLLLLFLVLMMFRIEGHEAFGLSDTIDTILTGTTEKFVNGEVVHSNI